jgi:hypothetical protein
MQKTVSRRVARYRRGALGVGLLAIAAFVAYSVTQIVYQVFFPEIRDQNGASCRVELTRLYGALERATRAGEEEAEVSKAISAFRQSLRPEWDDFGAARHACEGTPETRRGLDALERLRYAEEHAVRLEASSLHVLRNRVRHDLGELGALPAPEANQILRTNP